MTEKIAMKKNKSILAFRKNSLVKEIFYFIYQEDHIFQIKKKVF